MATLNPELLSRLIAALGPKVKAREPYAPKGANIPERLVNQDTAFSTIDAAPEHRELESNPTAGHISGTGSGPELSSGTKLAADTLSPAEIESYNRGAQSTVGDQWASLFKDSPIMAPVRGAYNAYQGSLELNPMVTGGLYALGGLGAGYLGSRFFRDLDKYGNPRKRDRSDLLAAGLAGLGAGVIGHQFSKGRTHLNSVRGTNEAIN